MKSHKQRANLATNNNEASAHFSPVLLFYRFLRIVLRALCKLARRKRHRLSRALHKAASLRIYFDVYTGFLDRASYVYVAQCRRIHA